MQNGGLSSILDPYSLLAGAGGLTSGSTTGPTSANSLLKGNNPYATQLNRSQISRFVFLSNQSKEGDNFAETPIWPYNLYCVFFRYILRYMPNISRGRL